MTPSATSRISPTRPAPQIAARQSTHTILESPRVRLLIVRHLYRHPRLPPRHPPPVQHQRHVGLVHLHGAFGRRQQTARGRAGPGQPTSPPRLPRPKTAFPSRARKSTAPLHAPTTSTATSRPRRQAPSPSAGAAARSFSTASSPCKTRRRPIRSTLPLSTTSLSSGSSVSTNVTTTQGNDLLLDHVVGTGNGVTHSLGANQVQTYMGNGSEPLGKNSQSYKAAASSSGTETMTRNFSPNDNNDDLAVIAVKQLSLAPPPAIRLTCNPLAMTGSATY